MILDSATLPQEQIFLHNCTETHEQDCFLLHCLSSDLNI